MTVRFATYRVAFYITVVLLSGAVLGLAAHFQTVFPSGAHHDFPIFGIVVPALNIFLFLLSLQWALPGTEAVELSILAILWLAMGAWSTDIIGSTQCDTLGGQRLPTKSGSIPYQNYCYEMKVIQAFSWMNFVLFAFALIILMQLITQAQMFGRFNVWVEPIRELPWFGEAPGYYNTYSGQYPNAQMYPMMTPGMQPVTPGHTVVIQPNAYGQPPNVTQIHG